MRKHRIIKALAVIISVLGLGLIGSNVNQISHVTPTITAYAKDTEAGLTNRIANFAAQRQQYYYPQITYNTRDLGGLRTKNGKYEIKPHMLYRSANLHYITPDGVNEVNHLRIHNDIDLRQMYGPNVSIHTKPQPGEFHLMPSKGLHIHYYQYAVEDSKEEAETWPIRKRLGETYRFGYWHTKSPTARKAYHDSIMEMIRNGRNPRRNGALMFNCTQGRDRTGVLAAITEYILGMSKATIYNDFLLINYYKYQSPYMDQISRINRFYDTVDKNYGNMWNYVRYGLNLSYNDINTLRHEYLKRI